jgi:hypothetical protein
MALDRRPPPRKLADELHELCPEQDLADTVHMFLNMDAKTTREQTPRAFAATCAFAEDSFGVLARKKSAKLPEFQKLSGEKCTSR